MAPLEILVCAVLILMSAFMSSSEIALFSLSRFQLRGLKDQIQPQTHRKMKRLLQDPGGLLITILVVNEIVNISLSSLITEAIAINSAHPTGPENWVTHLFISTTVTTLLILLLCEVTPKVIGARANQLVATACAPPLSIVYDFMKPVRILLRSIVALLSNQLQSSQHNRSEGHGENHNNAILKESEFLMMVEEGQREGAIHQSEVDLIKNVFELDDTRVQSILTPLPQVHTILIDTTIKAALATMRSHRYSRIPVTTNNRRQIVGMLYTKDMLRAKLEQGMMNQPVSELMRKPLIVHPSMQLNALFRKFKQNRNHMAVVQKQSGETLGIVTMNDVLESLFGDLLPEHEEEENV